MTDEVKRNPGGRKKNPDYLSPKQTVAVEAFLSTWNKTKAAEIAGYAMPHQAQSKLFSTPRVKEAIKKRLDEMVMDSNEIIAKMNQIADLNISDFYTYDKDGVFSGVNWGEFRKRGYLVKRLFFDRHGIPTLEFHDSMRAKILLGREKGTFNENGPASNSVGAGVLTSLPADVIAPAFIDAYRDIRDHKHTEYLFYGGRGSTKSSFVSLAIIYLIINNPTMHALATRQVGNTLRDSVYSQLQWAINELGLTESFKCITSPLEITYIPTGQKIFFRGFDDVGKIKSIKPAFGYLGILWAEECDQMTSPEAVRKVEQSLRGGDVMYFFKSWNPPRSAQSWINKYSQIPKAAQYKHSSNYLTVPPEWLGGVFISEAEHLKSVNLKAYENEYLGVVNGTGGQVFENVIIRAITDDEISQFDRVMHGLDFGFYPDPAHYSRVHYDAARLTLYIYGEVRKWKTANRGMYDAIVEYGHNPADLMICDSAEPKSVADFASYGASVRGAEKGADSVLYSIKWLQSLKEIVIDNERCPYTADEFMSYEYERTKEDEIISAFPDKNNHAIDSVRYATNLIWRQRGK